ncbi:MAG TPA: hypothetical protein V6C69_09910 [Trichormus sp.]
MRNVENFTNDIEQALAKHDSTAMQKFVQDLHAWKPDGTHAATQKQIDKELQFVNNKLHHDGYLPGLNIVGFSVEKEAKGNGKGDGEPLKLILNAKGTSNLFSVDSHGKELDMHRKEMHTNLDAPQTLTQWADKIGWSQSKAHPGEQFMEGNHGELFKYEKQKHDFIQVNDKGQPVDAKGHVVSEAKALHVKPGDSEHMGNDTMVGRAKVKPASDDFNDPKTMLDSAMKQFHGDWVHRAQLRYSNPELYNACKFIDQRQIDEKFGWGKVIRDFDDSLIPDTPKNQLYINKLEKSYADGLMATPDTITRPVTPPDTFPAPAVPYAPDTPHYA